MYEIEWTVDEETKSKEFRSYYEMFCFSLNLVKDYGDSVGYTTREDGIILHRRQSEKEKIDFQKCTLKWRIDGKQYSKDFETEKERDDFAVDIFIEHDGNVNPKAWKDGRPEYYIHYSKQYLRSKSAEKLLRNCDNERDKDLILFKFDYDSFLKSETWKKARKATLERDDHKCCVCGSDHNLRVHHKIYDNNRPDDIKCLVTLCDDCHSLLHRIWGNARYHKQVLMKKKKNYIENFIIKEYFDFLIYVNCKLYKSDIAYNFINSIYLYNPFNSELFRFCVDDKERIDYIYNKIESTKFVYRGLEKE